MVTTAGFLRLYTDASQLVPRSGRRPEQIYDELRCLHGLLRRFHGVCVDAARSTLRETRGWRLERLAELGSAGKVVEQLGGP